MAIIFDHRDESEQIYTAKFLSSANRHGIAVRYETDRWSLPWRGGFICGHEALVQFVV